SQLSQRQMQTAALQWLNPASSAWTKIFERVPGATIAGTGPVDTDVTASVQLRIPGGRNFTYSQRATTGPDGEFTMTVPYSTTGYAQWGPDKGHTNVSVRATGPYTIRTERERDGGNVTYYQGTVNVTEAAVVGERDATATVTLEQQNRSLQSPGGGDSETGGESGPSESSDASGTATSEAVGRSIGAPAQARAAPDR
ncbi:MAG: hypothetical protein V5A18_03105, partial [Haloarculaceae archaeon]